MILLKTLQWLPILLGVKSKVLNYHVLQGPTWSPLCAYLLPLPPLSSCSIHTANPSLTSLYKIAHTSYIFHHHFFLTTTLIFQITYENWHITCYCLSPQLESRLHESRDLFLLVGFVLCSFPGPGTLSGMCSSHSVWLNKR